MYAHTHIYIYIYIYHSMWTSQTSTRYVWEAEPGVPCFTIITIGMLKFHNDNDNEYENDNEISLSFMLGFCTQIDGRLIASISSSTTTIPNMNPARTQEMMMSAHINFVLVLVVVVVVKS